MKLFLLLSSLSALFASISAHTVTICALVTGNTVEFYAGTYHYPGEAPSPVGGIILSNGPSGNGRYDFTSYVGDNNEAPSGITGFTCTECANSQYTDIQHWQYVQISGLSDGTYNVVTTTDTAVEYPWCFNFPSITIEGIASQPTPAPTWVAECDDDPCDCSTDSHCIVCDTNGCDQCENNYFKLDYNYPCVNCQNIFGNECLHCQDFNGCAQCDNEYDRIYDSEEDLYYCEISSSNSEPNPAPVSDGNCDLTNEELGVCTNNYCIGENSHCSVWENWGSQPAPCATCETGYFFKSQQHKCILCSNFEGCTQCSNYAGCQACDTTNGYAYYWDSDCGIGRCYQQY